MITKEEQWALNILTVSATNIEQELGRVKAAKDFYIKSLEEKYGAVFNSQSGEFAPKQGD